MLTPVDINLLPADVRDAGPEARKVYGAALGFERTFLLHLTEALVKSAQGDDEEAAASNPYTSMLPGAMADGLVGAGGLGLADELYRSLALQLGIDGATAGGEGA